MPATPAGEGRGERERDITPADLDRAYADGYMAGVRALRGAIEFDQHRRMEEALERAIPLGGPRRPT